MNWKFVKVIQSMEKVVEHCSKNCFNCIYKDVEINHCWYTMTTNNLNKISDNKCSHYVNKDEALSRINVIRGK